MVQIIIFTMTYFEIFALIVYNSEQSSKILTSIWDLWKP